jgi:signal peptidase II
MKNSTFILLFAIFVAGCAADFITKQMVVRHVQQKSPVTIIHGFLEFSYVENRGMVFGFLNKEHAGFQRYVLAGLKILSIFIIVMIIWRIRALPALYHLPFFLILAGAVGNVIDRIRYGHVIDFIHMHWRDSLDYPWLYNVADALVVVGMFLLAILLLLKKNVYESVVVRQKDENSLFQ